MNRTFQAIIAAGLLAVFAFAVLTRGAYLRIFWPGAAVPLAAMFASFLFSLIHGDADEGFNPRTDLALAAFLSWAIVSVFASINPEQSVYEVLRLAGYVMAYFLAGYALREAGFRHLLLLGLAAVVLIEAGYGLAVQFTGKTLLEVWWFPDPAAVSRAHGTYLNPNHFAGLMEMGSMVGFGLILAVDPEAEARTELWAKRLLLALGVGIMVIALVLSLSAGGWASLAGGVIFVISLVWRRLPRMLPAALAAAVVVAVVAGSVMIKADRAPLADKVESLEILSQGDLSANERVGVWKSALRMVRDHPVAGMGWGTFRSAYPSYRQPNLYYGFVFAHNDYLQIAAGMGVVGLLLFLGFVGLVFREGIRVIESGERDPLALAMPGVLAAMFAVLVHELVDFNLMVPSHAILFFVLAGLVAARARELS
jgi:putative inorganic carbon (hco3(-)) transporter